MKTAIPKFTRSLFLSSTLLVAESMIFFSLTLVAQPAASSSVAAQREAMRKLSFLSGHWAGPVTIVRGTGEPVHLAQSEDVEYKLDGLVLLIDGRSASANGKVLFSALATIAYDDTSRSYRFRAYHDGHYLDTELLMLEHGFSWGFTSGPAHIVNTMQLTDKGEWNEFSEVTVGSNPPHRSVEMLLQHQPAAAKSTQ
jgi:hypothetical protein